MEKEEQKQRFPNLKIIAPVAKSDESGRYSKAEVDESRTKVTSIRACVEQVHGAQKHWLALRNKQTLQEYFHFSSFFTHQ